MFVINRLNLQLKCQGSWTPNRTFYTSVKALEQHLLEERALPRYHQKRFYPVSIDQVLNERYRVLRKLGYGSHSTVWLARDESTQQHVAVKVCIEETDQISPISNEVTMLRHLSAVAAQHDDHTGLNFVRLASDTFELHDTPHHHHCIVAKPYRFTLHEAISGLSQLSIPLLVKVLVKDVVLRLLLAVNWLHVDCDVIHTDIRPTNVLLETTDENIFNELEQDSLQNPTLPVDLDGLQIYPSLRWPFNVPDLTSIPILTDFGQMRPFKDDHTEWLMTDNYRAPEILLQIPWNGKVDIWSIGIMMLELLEQRNLFNPVDQERQQYVQELALSQYVGYLGSPPVGMIRQSPYALEFFDEKGNWASQAPIPQVSLDDFVTCIEGEEKVLFMKFLRKMLTWDPEKRATSSELLEDEWLLHKDF